MAIEEQIRSLIANQLDIEVDGLSSDTFFRSLPNITSMKILQIILEVEKSCDVELDDDVTFRVQTVGEFEAEVKRLRDKSLLPADAE